MVYNFKARYVILCQSYPPTCPPPSSATTPFSIDLLRAAIRPPRAGECLPRAGVCFSLADACFPCSFQCITPPLVLLLLGFLLCLCFCYSFVFLYFPLFLSGFVGCSLPVPLWLDFVLETCVTSSSDPNPF